MQAVGIYPDAPYVQDDRLIDNDLLAWNHHITCHNFFDVYNGNGSGTQRLFNVGFHFSVCSWTTVQTTGEMGWTIPIGAGTWTVVWYTGKRNDYGISHARVDGAQVGSTVDLYVNNAAHQQMIHTVSGLVLAAGEHSFTFKQNGTKNAASSGYIQVVSGLCLTRTA